MKLYVATCQHEKVLSVIDLMKRNNIHRNVLSYNLWMNACAEVSGVDSVQSVFQVMLNDETANISRSKEVLTMHIDILRFSRDST
jgi:pentatricopeptide repeat protein